MCEIIGCICDFIKSIWNWLELNVSTLKDVLGIVFTFVATVVGYKTYRRARYTLLQPIKTELLKKQTELFVELLDFLGGESSLYMNLDYIGICVLNVFRMIEYYEAPHSDIDNEEEITKMEGGVMYFDVEYSSLKEISAKSIESIEDMEKRIILKNKLKEEDIKRLVQGCVDLREIHLTIKHINCRNRLNYFTENPFMPKEITDILLKIDRDIENNICNVAKEHFQDFMLSLYFSDSITENLIVKFDAHALYNEFSLKSTNHKDEVEEIRKIIREKLMVDSKWMA